MTHGTIVVLAALGVAGQVIAALLVIVVVIYLFYQSSIHESTDDAYTTGHLHNISNIPSHSPPQQNNTNKNKTKANKNKTIQTKAKAALQNQPVMLLGYVVGWMGGCAGL